MKLFKKSSDPNDAANSGDSLSKPLTRGAAATMLSNQLPKWRPQSWEDDISCNALDEQPFNNLDAAADLKHLLPDYQNHVDVLQPLLTNVTVEDFLARDTLPLPCPADRENYSPDHHLHYWLSGLTDYLKVMQVANDFNLAPKSVFELGCASGRVLRHFAIQSDIPEVWGSDINRRHVRWLYEHLPQNVKPVFNHCIPTLPMRDGSIDLITAFSVFTHIDTFETCWLAELSRILSDDGICYLTVHNNDTWNKLAEAKDNDAEDRLLNSMTKIDPDIPELVKQPMPGNRLVYRFAQGGPYRAQVFHSNEYLHKVWGRFFRIEKILPCHHGRQTVLVLRQK